MVERCEDLEELDEKREKAQKRSHRYRQRMNEAYVKKIRERMFTEGHLVLRTTDHIRRGMVGPYKFLPKWTLCGKGNTCNWVLSFSVGGWKRFNRPH